MAASRSDCPRCRQLAFCHWVLAERTDSMGKEYLHFDEIEDVLSSLDLLALVTPLLKKHPSYWKWAIIAAHAGLQGAMVCALRDTTGVSVLEKKCAREMLDWLETQKGNPPEEKLADFNTLLSRSTKAVNMDNQPLTLTGSQTKDVTRLHRDFRNNFSHFVPKSWCIEKAGLPRIVRAAVHATDLLMQNERVDRQLSGNRKRRLARQLKTIREGLTG
jgi:hypothetical protein